MLAVHWSSRCPGTLHQLRSIHAQPLRVPTAHARSSRIPNCVAAARPQLWGSQGSSNSRRSRSLHVVRVAKSLLDVIEGLKQQADALQAELSEAGKAAEVAAKRRRRLAERSRQLQDYALEHVMVGDEPGARSALLQKASVADALAAASRRAEANIALARKLEDVLTEKQLQLLKLIRQAKEQADARDAAAAAAAATDGAGSNEPSSRGLKRSRSVAWDSPTLHASSDAVCDALGLGLQHLATESSSVSGSDGEGQSAGADDERGSVSHTNGRRCGSNSSSSDRWQ